MSDAIDQLNAIRPETIFRKIEDLANTETIRTNFLAATGSTVDAASGIIRACSVITANCEARGHDLSIDMRTLVTVAAAAKAFAHGVKVKVDHGTGLDGIIGSLKDFRLSGQKLVADLHLLRTHPGRDRVLELAGSIPESFGLSISFSGTPEIIDGKKFARCSELYSIDLVSDPAANPDGLFETAEIHPACRRYADLGKSLSATPAAKDTVAEARKLFPAMSAMEPKQKTIFYRQHKATLDEAHNLIAAHDAKPKQKFSATQLADLATVEEYESISDSASKIQWYRSNKQSIDRFYRENPETVKFGKPTPTGIQILDEHNAITDPAERVTHYKSNQRAIDLAFENLSRKQNL